MRKVAVITGASRGIGRALALKYAGENYDIAISCLRQEKKLMQTAEEARSLGAECVTFVGDMGNADAVDTFFQRIRQRYPDIHLLINNAGISHIGLLQDMTPEEWDRVMSSNLRSAFLCSRAVIPGMVAAKSGRILNISSVWGSVGASTEVAYSAAKGAVNTFTKALARELAPSNIQVNAIACGMIDTEMNHCFSPEEIASIKEEIPAGRIGTPGEVAELAFRLTQDHSYLTGQIIALDGGWC